jgi:AcrR family transcriptional regulator
VETTAARRRLLDAAVQAFAEHGYGGTSTRDIAERAGRSPAAVYIHYESKEALLHAASLHGHEDSLDCLTQAYDATDDPAARLHGMVLDFTMWHIDHAKVARIVQYELHALTPEHREEIVTLRRRFQQLMAQALQAGIDAGRFEVDDVDGTARAVLSLCIDLVRWFDPDLSKDHKAVARLNADLALRMVGGSRA